MAEELCKCSAETGGLTYQGTYAEYKSTLDAEIRKTAEGFVRVGYLLKIARDTNILYESGYGSVAEFARAEYGLSKDVVSRYIAINDKYSEGGYSDRLEERFRGFGVAKLAEMLTLPESVISAMDPQLTKAQIREVKEEVKAEMEITPIEAALEQQEEGQREYTPLQLFLRAYFRKEPQKFLVVHKYTLAGDISDNRLWIEQTLDVMCPAGNGCESVRIPGRGRLLLFFHGREQDLELVEVRADVKQKVSWSGLREEVLKMCVRHEEAEKAWENLFGEPFPEVTKEEPKTEEPEKGEKAVTQQGPKKSAIGKLKETIRKAAGKEKPKTGKVAPAQLHDVHSNQENDHSGQENDHSDQENDHPNQGYARLDGKESGDVFMNPPEVIPEEDTEVETDFWMIRRGIKAYIDQLLEQFMKTDWDGMEETMKEIKNEIARIREEGGGNE